MSALAQDAPRSAYDLLNALEGAKDRLKGTIGLLTIVVDEDREHDEGVVWTIERHLLADVKALDEAFSAAWDGLLKARTGGAP